MMKKMKMTRFTWCEAFCLFVSMIMIMIMIMFDDVAEAQPSTSNSTITDPSEVAALNAIFGRWGIPPSSATTQGWNTSGEVCSGAALDATSLSNINPGLKCDCSDTVCHITGLRVYARDVTGELPDELWNLTFLISLDLGQNYLSGPLPASIARLSRMQYLSLGINAFSGQLPKELGNLTDLISLSFSTNNFSGALPDELGSLTRLTQIYFDSSGVSGAIPPTFANLRSLQTVWASDNALTGEIPDFIGNWSQLTTLRFQGNSFRGGIPDSFYNLTAMEDLRISDLSNGTTSLDFIRNMKSLTRLVLRNNNISGSIPSNIGEYPLTQLDLSFNDMTGRIPDALFNLSSLSYLFLGNNKFTGPLPANKSSSLQAIDLSYNELSGSFPSWASDSNLQLNLVANNFTVSDSNRSGLPSGLNCLQRDFPCNRGSPIYARFSIKCGGPQMSSSDQTVYESENETLGPATYYMSNQGRWAVSNVGLPSDSRNPLYKTQVTSQFTNTLDTELYQTARVSAGSLRYYGLGLENGNYTVNLHFAESSILDGATWQSLGRRLFDIYIQGNRVLQDFDTQREAGGSFRAIQRQFQAQVSQNFLEIHLFWAGKGTCCVPAQGVYGPSISAISATPNFEPSVTDSGPSEENNPSGGKDRTGLIVGILVPLGIVSLVALCAAYYIVQRRKRKPGYDDEEFLSMEAKPYTFTFAELRAATDDLSPTNKLGEGGFGPVFKGMLEDGRVIAVKQLSVASRQGKSQFVAEIATISAVQHRNLVKLYGCCIEGDKRLLVYEYLENKSLDQALFGKNLYLDWPTRFDICLGVGKGLAYLHEESRLRIVHRDVKASNILLDTDLTPKISDFGLAKLYDDKKTHISTRVAGTIGYLAPEYAMRGHLTEKADVFGFGVVALEIISGRPNTDSNLEEDKIYLLELAWELHEENRELGLVDADLPEFNADEVKRVIGVALLCTQTSPGLRPSMSRVVAMLAGDIEVPAVTSRPGYLTDWKYTDSTTINSFMNDDAPTTTHYGTTSTTTRGTPASYSPTNGTQPILHEIIGEGR